jgi:hypothetical protein
MNWESRESDRAARALRDWYEALRVRYRSELEFAEVRRALEALSGLYVSRRKRLRQGHGLDSAGKRAAFALFYGPLHFLQVHHVVVQRGLASKGIEEVIDLGCGTGFSGIGWAFAADGHVKLHVYDSKAWAVEEAAWTLALTGFQGRSQVSDMTRVRLRGKGQGILCSFALNELAPEVRAQMRTRLAAAVKKGAVVLIVEPIARWAAPWLSEWADALSRFRVRHDEWRLSPELPEGLRLLDKAAGLDHRTLTCQSLLIEPV